MKKVLSSTLLCAIVLFCSVAFTQDNTLPLRLKAGDFQLEDNIRTFGDQHNFTPDELIEGRYYRIIQFAKIPSNQDKAELEESGIQLLQYLPDHAFYASIAQDANLEVLPVKKVNSVVDIIKEYKLNEILIQQKYPDWALAGNDNLILNAAYHQSISKAYLLELLFALNVAIVADDFPGVITIQVPFDQLGEVYAHPAFYYFEALDQPGEPEDYQDVANHRTNWLNNATGTGMKYDGTGVTVMIQDDGPIGPHIDYQGRTITSTASNFGDHGDHCSGIIVGAGNLDPDGVGNAPGAELLVYASANSNYDLVPLLYETAELVITSKSYGNGENAGYTTLARTLDEQCYEHDALIHVFSAGNSGTENYGYGAGAGWGNITGGHKQGKNVVAVGNLSSNDVLSNSSSRGPADDGRIKPNICAVGTSVYSTVDPNTYDIKSGTSMACPGVAGALAVLYEAYKDMHNGQNPDAALMIGAILNTADDLGNPGPDFKFGWGRINVRKAYNLIEQEQYLEGEVGNGEVDQVSINIPENTKQLKVMVYWTDYPGSPSASKALVNDINMSITGPDGSSTLPLVLNPTPNAGILNNDAQPGIDDLNNAEQIVIDNPLAGNYTIQISGFNIPQGPQSYYIVYETVVEDLVLTFPIGGEGVNPGESEVIRWDALGEDQTFQIDYSVDAGLTWQSIAGSIPGDWRTYPWVVPGTLLSGEARIRITRGADVVESKDFSIIDQPVNLNVEWACPNSFNFSWNPVNGAVAYEVFLLGDKYMDSAGYTTTTNATIYANSLETQWVSVRAIGPDNAVSKRAIALQKTPGAFGCTLSEPVADFISYCSETAPGTCVLFEDISTNAGQGAAWEWYFPGGTPDLSNLEKPLICYETEGYYDVQLIVKNGVGEDTIFSSQHVHIKLATELPYKEDFESGIVPTEWMIENNGSTVNWTIDQNVSAYNVGNNCLTFDHFSNDSSGSSASFMTEMIHLATEGIFYELNFDVAYAGEADSLKIYVTRDCGISRQMIYSKGGTQLQTSEAVSTFFIPNVDDWRNEHIALTNFVGDQSVSFIFETYSATGNALYVDNINIRVSEENFSTHELTVFPNPFDEELHIAGLVEGEATTIRLVSAGGKLIMEKAFDAPGGTIILNTAQLADGMYIIKIKSESKTHKEKLIKGDG